MSQLPDALIIIDTTREQNAVNEARRLGIPTVAIVDTNADPEIIDYPIPGNDDAIRAIRVMLQKLVDAIDRMLGDAAAGRAPDLEALCREYPDIADELKSLWAWPSLLQSQ